MRLAAFWLILLTFLVGCGREKFAGDPASPLGTTPPLYLAQPEDYRPPFNDPQVGYGYFAGTGRIVQGLLHNALRRRFDQFAVAPEPRILDDDILFARSAGSQYLIRPVILEWRDDKHDHRAIIRLATYDTKSLELIDEETVEVDDSRSPVYDLRDELEDYAEDWDFD